MNQEIEAWVRQSPAQYYWVHKRFKTRPEGDPEFY
jgi:KDO2-lipid IV(A) lauroyltransferase